MLMADLKDLLKKSGGKSSAELGAPIPSFPTAVTTITPGSDAQGVRFDIPLVPDSYFQLDPSSPARESLDVSLIACTGTDLTNGTSTTINVAGSSDGTFSVRRGAKRTEIRTEAGEFERAVQPDYLDVKVGAIYIFYMLVSNGAVSQPVHVKVDFS